MSSDFLTEKTRRVFMKRLSMALVLGFLISAFCFAQTQTGNASYNLSKGGLTISHPSLSFNTHVRVTNLRNSRSIEAVVNGRIPISDDRIADISRDAGDTLGMDKTGMTLIEIEILPGRGNPAAPVSVAPVPADPVPPAPAAQTPAPQPKPQPPKAEPAAPPPASLGQAAPPPPAPAPPVQTITDVQYIPVPAPAYPCCSTPLLIAVLVLLILVLAILVFILILLARRFPLWPWHYPFWLRRRYRYAKSKRSG
jgi:hypothetical protein